MREFARADALKMHQGTCALKKWNTDTDLSARVDNKPVFSRLVQLNFMIYYMSTCYTI